MNGSGPICEERTMIIDVLELLFEIGRNATLTFHRSEIGNRIGRESKKVGEWLLIVAMSIDRGNEH